MTESRLGTNRDAERKGQLLLYVTYQYPFGDGEGFVEAELAVVARAFDKVVVLPSRAYFSPRWWRKVDKDFRRAIPVGCQLLTPRRRSFRAFLRVAFGATALLRNARLLVPTGSSPVRMVFEVLRQAYKASAFREGCVAVTAPWDSVSLAYTYWKNEATVALLSLRKTRQLAFRVVTRAHGGDLYYSLPDRPSRPFDPYLAATVDRVFPVSSAGARHLVEHGFEPAKVLVARLGVRIPSGLSSPSNDGCWRIVSCSSLLPVKRVPLLVAALTQLKHDFVWTHHGDGIERAEVERLVRHLPPNGVARLRGTRGNAEVLEFYRGEPCDVFVNVSSSEGVPVAVMEALAVGIPCIATDVGGTSEVVDAEVGTLVRPDVTSGQLAAALESLLSDVHRIRNCRLNARRRAETLCDADQNYMEFAAILQSVALRRSE